MENDNLYILQGTTYLSDGEYLTVDVCEGTFAECERQFPEGWNMATCQYGRFTMMA